MKTIEEYEKQQAIRKWNASFCTPPVCTAGWNEKDFQMWEEMRKPLPPFEIWKNQ